jgi:hypothetical protein
MHRLSTYLDAGKVAAQSFPEPPESKAQSTRVELFSLVVHYSTYIFVFAINPEY